MTQTSHGNRVARGDEAPVDGCADLLRESLLACLVAAIDCSGLPRKAIAADAGLSEAQLSKVLAGVQGLPPDFIDRLPRHVRVDFLRRLAVRDGVLVRDFEPWEAQVEVIEAADELCRRLLRLRAIRCQALADLESPPREVRRVA